MNNLCIIIIMHYYTNISITYYIILGYSEELRPIMIRSDHEYIILCTYTYVCIHLCMFVYNYYIHKIWHEKTILSLSHYVQNFTDYSFQHFTKKYPLILFYSHIITYYFCVIFCALTSRVDA